jgi:polyferredoxin
MRTVVSCFRRLSDLPGAQPRVALDGAQDLLPYSIQSLLSGHGWLMSGLKSGILLGFVVSCLVVHRPWCRIFCPLGGLLALFNRWSLFHLRYQAKACVECNLQTSDAPRK